MNKIIKTMAVVLAAAAITVSAGAKSVSASPKETAYDTQFLNDMGACPDRWGEFKTLFSWSTISRTADGAWARMGVRSVTDYWDNNQYYINGRKVTRQEAYDYVANKLGKTYNKDKFFPAGKNHSKKPHKCI